MGKIEKERKSLACGLYAIGADILRQSLFLDCMFENVAFRCQPSQSAFWLSPENPYKAQWGVSTDILRTYDVFVIVVFG